MSIVENKKPMLQAENFHIPALDCPDELALIERSLRRTSGISQVAPDYLGRNLRVEFDAAHTNAQSILSAIQSAGFPADIAIPLTSTATSPVGQKWGAFDIPRTVVAGAAFLISATVSAFVGGQPWVTASLAIGSAIASSIPVATAAWRAVRLRAWDMNVLMILAAGGAIAIADFFEAATAMLLFAFSLWLERISLDRARRATLSLLALAPNVAHRMLNAGTSTEQVVDVDAAELVIGDQVLVRPGERIPADAAVQSGESAVNQAPITGESVPVEKSPGDRVFAGTLNGEGSLVLRITHTSTNSTLARVGRLIEEARASRSRMERFIDAFARRYTPAVIVLALAVMLVPSLLAWSGVTWAATVGPIQWIHRGLVLLVIACPCALVISTPVTIVSGLYRAAQAGILVKGAEFLEKAANLRAVAIDKTGTVTTGVMHVVQIESFGERTTDDVISLAAALEQHSEHPVAQAIRTAAVERQLVAQTIPSVLALRGFGVRGDVNGETYFLGSPRLFRNSDFQFDASQLARLDRTELASRDAATRVLLGTPTRLLGEFLIADRPRHSAAGAIAELRALGIHRIVMLTGDNAAAAQAVAQEIGIEEVFADLLPQQKIEHVRSLSALGSLAMVGDGVNDAPALAAADLGIALGGQSSDTALETADVVVMSPDLSKLAELIRISRRCRTLLKQNIAFSLTTKVAVMIVAALGLVTMWMAVASDVGASLIVIANGLRIIDSHSPGFRPVD
jgi:Zn2+/Cd2+-exporting ATPase